MDQYDQELLRQLEALMVRMQALEQALTTLEGRLRSRERRKGVTR